MLPADELALFFPRPILRGDCANGLRPCPFVSCKHHLYMEVAPRTGKIRTNHRDKEPWDLAETCVLDLSDRGGMTLEEVGQVLGITRERVRQIEARALNKMRARQRKALLEEMEPEP